MLTIAITVFVIAGCAGDDQPDSNATSNGLKPLDDALCMQSESDSLLGELSGDFNQNEIDDTFRLFYDKATGESRLVLCELNQSNQDSIVFLLDFARKIDLYEPGSLYDVFSIGETGVRGGVEHLFDANNGKVLVVSRSPARRDDLYESWLLRWSPTKDCFEWIGAERHYRAYGPLAGKYVFIDSNVSLNTLTRKAHINGQSDCLCEDTVPYEWDFWCEDLDFKTELQNSDTLPNYWKAGCIREPSEECPPMGSTHLPYGDTLIQNLNTVFFENEFGMPADGKVVPIELGDYSGPSNLSAGLIRDKTSASFTIAFDFGSGKFPFKWPIEITKSKLANHIQVSEKIWADFEPYEPSECSKGRNYIQVGSHDFNEDGIVEVVLAYGTNAGDSNGPVGDLMLIEVFAFQDPLWCTSSADVPVRKVFSIATGTNSNDYGTRIDDDTILDGRNGLGWFLAQWFDLSQEGMSKWTSQTVVTPYGVVYPTTKGLHIKSADGLKQLTFNSNDFSPAYVCGGDAEIYFLRGTDYMGAYDYPAYVTKLMRLDLTTGFEEQILLTPENEITPEVGSLTHGDLSLAKSIDKNFRGYPDENDLIEVKGSHFSRLDAGCTYPYLFFEIPGYHQWDFVYKYDIRNGSFQVINYVLGFEVIKSGEYKGLLLGNRSFIREGLGRVWGDILFNENGETLKELSEADASGSRGASYRQRGMSILNCSTCDYQERDGRSDVSRIDASLAEGLMSTGIEFRESPQKSEISSIAVIPRPGIDCEGQAVSSDGIVPSVEGALLEVYKVVDRGNLDELLAEQKLSLSGLVQSELIEAGNTAGAEGFLFCEVGCFGGESTIDLRLVDAETSAVQWTCTGRGVGLQGFLTQLTEKLNSGDNSNTRNSETTENFTESGAVVVKIPEVEIRAIISEYYEFVMNDKWRKIEGLYADRLSRFFDEHDISKENAIERAKSYDEELGVVSKRHEIRWETLQTSMDGSNMRVNFNLDYFLRRKNQPNERHFVLKITMLLDENGKIVAVWE